MGEQGYPKGGNPREREKENLKHTSESVPKQVRQLWPLPEKKKRTQDERQRVSQV